MKERTAYLLAAALGLFALGCGRTLTGPQSEDGRAPAGQAADKMGGGGDPTLLDGGGNCTPGPCK